jgi:hypothetical protein
MFHAQLSSKAQLIFSDNTAKLLSMRAQEKNSRQRTISTIKNQACATAPWP